MSVTFIKDASTLTFPASQNRQYPLSDKEGHEGVLLRTKAGVIAVDVRKAANPLQIVLSLGHMEQAFYDGLEAWFFNISKGKLYKFNYTNSITGESSVPVRWTNGFNFSVDDLYFSGEIVLEKELA